MVATVALEISGPMPGSHEPFARRIFLCQLPDFAGNLLDAIVEPAPIRNQGLDDPDDTRQEQVSILCENFRKCLAKTLNALCHGNTAIQQEGADLVHCGRAFAHKPCAHEGRNACRSSCSTVLVATKRMVGRCTASAIASASR
jgi:hypothetical protein